RSRRVVVLLFCVAACPGWIPGLWTELGHEAPVDVWQPEAITFLSLYLNPLFVMSQLLMVGVLGWLLVAERDRTMKPAIYAGLCALLLGNIHTYDAITVVCVWTAYLLVRAVANRRIDWGAWLRAIVAGIPAALSAGYMFYLFRTESVFAQRVAVATESPPFMRYLLGYGLTL